MCSRDAILPNGEPNWSLISHRRKKNKKRKAFKVDFKKYSSIDNHYQTKTLMRWLAQFPDLANEEFVLEEKVDGANIQIYIDPTGEIKVGKRSSFIGEEDNFFGVWDIVKNKYWDRLQILAFTAKSTGESYRLYGEVYGPGVQKRIKYRAEAPDILFFDVMINDEFISPKDFHERMLFAQLPIVPIIKRTSTLNEALAYPREFRSWLSDTDDAEGFVIKPWNQNFFLGCGSRFIYKAKSDAFAEKMDVQVKERKELPANVLAAFTEFQGYATDNRLDNVIGNNGPLERPNQIGDYIKLMLEDMKKDFKADGFDESKFEPDELKKIYNVGHHIVPLIKARL